MKILFYSQSSTVYGSPASLVNLLSGLRDLDPGLEVKVVIPTEGELEEKLSEENIPYVIIPHSKWVFNHHIFRDKKRSNFPLSYLWLYKNITQRYVKNLLYRGRHEELVRDFRPDLIYVNSSIAPMGGSLAIKNDIPFFWHHRETVNDPVTGFFLDNSPLFRKHFRKADLHLYPSHFLRQSYSQFEGANHKVIYNGVPDTSGPKEPKGTEGPVKFGIVGRINEQKGQREVLEVLAALPRDITNYELHLFGDGPESFVGELRNDFPDSKILFRGFQEKDVIYKDIHYLIVNARNESFGRVVAEANAFAVPVIALKSGALKEIVFENINGFLYETAGELSVLLQKFILKNFPAGYYEKICKSARNCFLENFSIQACSEAVCSEIRKRYPNS